MHVGQIIGRVESERLDVEPADRAQQRIGRHHAVALRADQPRFGGDEILLRVQHIDRGALAALGLAPHAIERHRGSAHFGFRGADRDLGADIGGPGADHRGARLVADLVEHLAALRHHLLGLPGLRGGDAAVIDRGNQLAADAGLPGAPHAERGVGVGFPGGGALQRQGRQQPAFGDLDRSTGDIDVKTRGHHRRMLLLCLGDCVLAVAWQQPVDRVGRVQPGRRLADHLGVGRLADREIDFRGVEIGQTAIEAGLGLGGVGRGDIAGAEAALGDVERFAQEGDVGALRLHQRLVGEHVGEGSDGVEQHALADIAQRLAAGAHLQFGGANTVAGAEPVEQILVHGDADGPRLQRRGL